ncbi:GNAT family N-acetyltransferase [Paludibacterium paludis]|uniref:N-acetyltransferase domain-containing protein n=1 Tax=Paludibacterium paludis TaxID=1225769 RepID=A0A918P590_9NEIS|nr:GNAT family N-acetyltransferase [Paludibacterium paludis]GGY19030.1 hypothetical protein GCM10011289_23040 [Paludibacterium paludis]
MRLNQLAIRAMDEEHVPGVCRLHDDRDVLDAHPGLALNSRRHWETWLAGANSRRFDLVALRAERVIGWAFLSLHPRERRNHCAEIHLAVARDERRTGAGSRLMAGLLILADDLALGRLEARVAVNNTVALDFLAHGGFEREGMLRESRRAGSRWLDEIVLARLMER